MLDFNGASSTGRFFSSIGRCHDIESSYGVAPFTIGPLLLSTHFGQLAVIFLWLAGSLFHICWHGNFEIWSSNPCGVIPVAHAVWDPNFPSVNGTLDTDTFTRSYSGLYNILYTIGFRNSNELIQSTIALEIIAMISLSLSCIHAMLNNQLVEWLGWYSVSGPKGYKPTNTVSIYKTGMSMLYSISSILLGNSLRLTHHTASLLGFGSIAWAGHIVHCAIPASRGLSPTFNYYNLFGASEGLYSSNQISTSLDAENHIFGSNIGAGSSLLTFLSSFKTDSSSLFLSDIAHHHLALGALLIWSASLYSSMYKAFSHRIREANIGNSFGLTGYFSYMNSSLHLQLSVALLVLGIIVSWVASLVVTVPSYAYSSLDFAAVSACFVHHSWIAAFLLMGAFAHLSIFYVRDFVYSGEGSLGQCILSRLLLHKAAIISHLSWASLWLGFHTLALFIHNDVLSAFGDPKSRILVEPIFEHSKLILGSESKLSAIISTISVDKPFSSLGSSLFSSDLLLSHAVSLGLHTTLLILVKGALDGPGSRLFPDKSVFGYAFPCDGPGRGGTCDISSWDAFYLAAFWMLNTNSWLLFGFHWKVISLASGSSSLSDLMITSTKKLSAYNDSSQTLNGWFRDYLWFNSGSLIRGYDPSGSNDLSVWAWIFLAAHLLWATSFMFLISWRGYWQELIEIIAYMQQNTPILNDIWSSSFYSPVALSIVQARFVGLVHFAAGLIVTYAAFVLGSTT